jgi:hypothetical protein
MASQFKVSAIYYLISQDDSIVMSSAMLHFPYFGITSNSNIIMLITVMLLIEFVFYLLSKSSNKHFNFKIYYKSQL